MLKINHLTKKFGKNKALNDISLSIPKGSCYGIIGPNGAGKSTLLKIIATIIKESQGKVTIQEKVRIGYVPQEICLEESLSAVDNLKFFGELYGLKGQELKEQISHVLKKVGLTNRSKDKVREFSGGMKRRLNIGCALMCDPDLIILDEPTVGIDPQSRKFIFQLINELKERSCTIIYASHYMEEVEFLCDHIAFFDYGTVIENGEVDGVLKKYGETAIYVQGKELSVESLEHIGNITKYQKGYLISGENSLQILKEIITNYETKPEYIEKLELLKPSLEDIFMKFTGHELRDNLENLS